MTSLAVLLWSFIGAILCTLIAGFKGRSVIGWLCIGLLTGLLGIIVISCLPSLPSKATTVPVGPVVSDDKLAAALLEIAVEWELMHLLRQRGAKGSWPRDRFESRLDAALEEASVGMNAAWYQQNVLTPAEKEANRLSLKRPVPIEPHFSEA